MPPKRARPTQQQQTQQTRLFWDSKYEAEFLLNEHRKLLFGLHIDFAFLLDHGFHSCLEFLQFQNWESFLKISYDTDDVLLRQFFTNLKERNDSSGVFISIANGTNVEITAQSIAECLVAKTPGITASDLLEGTLPIDPYFSSDCKSFKFREALEGLHDPESVLPSSTSVVELSIENRLLHHILIYTITPRYGSKSVLSDVDVRLMYLLSNKIKVSLPKLLLHHMYKCSRTKDYAYPYGMFLTYYLAYLEVPRIPNDAIPPIVKHNQYSLSTLSLLFSKNGTTWTRKHRLGNPSGASSSAPPPRNIRKTRKKPVCEDVEEEQEQEGEDDDPTTLFDIERQMSNLNDDMSDMDQRIFDRLDDMDAKMFKRLDDMDARIFKKLEDMDTNMNARFDKLSQQFNDLRSQLE